MTRSKQTPAKHPQEAYAQHLADYYGGLTPGQRIADEKLNQLRADHLATFQDKNDKTTAEANEYDRQRIGFFAIVISFIVGGLLSNQIPNLPNVTRGVDTLAARSFFAASIIFALCSALLLFVEYSVIVKFFRRSIVKTQGLIEYIAANTWANSQELSEHERTVQDTIEATSPRTIQYAGQATLFISFMFLALWLIEKLFNPHWIWWVG